MTKLEELIEKNRSQTIDLNKEFNKLELLLKNSNYPQTSRLILDLSNRIIKIKDSILEISNSENYYSTQILMRTLIEHYLTFNYVCSRFTDDIEAKTIDKIGNQYYNERKQEENVSFWEAQIKILRLIGYENEAIEGKKTIFEKRFPELKNISKTKLRASNQHFKINSIIQYYLDRADVKNLKDDEDSVSLDNLRYLPKFVQLSSFIHGGPLAKELELSFDTNSQLQEKLYNLSFEAHAISNGVLSMLFFHFWTINNDEFLLAKCKAFRRNLDL
jgi:hypothetical protein